LDHGPTRFFGLTLTIVSGSLKASKYGEAAMDMDMRKLAAEAIGTFWLTFGGCGSAVLASAFPQVGIGLLGVSLAFGLTVLTMAYSIGHISGCHLNPAVTLGLAAGGRFPANQVIAYIVAQVIGAVIGAAVLYLIASGKAGFSLAGGFASNGYGDHSPGKYGLGACLIAEVVLTMMFLFIIMGSTHGKAPAGFAPIAIGLGLTHSPDQHSGDQHLGQSGAQHRTGAVRGRLGLGAALAFLDCAAHRRRGRRVDVPLAQRRAVRRGNRIAARVTRRRRGVSCLSSYLAPRSCCRAPPGPSARSRS
jgi:aquaporin Z